MNNIDKLIEEISIKGGGILQTIRQPGNQDLDAGDLVFIYPIVMDATLDRRYGNLIRDFVTVAFTNRIKQSNVLNVISDAASPGTVKSGGSEINPAQLLKQHLGRTPVDTTNPNDMLNQGGIDGAKKYDYTEALVQLRSYIKDQVKNNPEYSNLRPVISEVMAQNLIPIPLIIGTNQMKVNSNVLYWFLFVASGQKLPLDRVSSLEPIKRHLREIDVDKYEDFMKGIVPDKNLDSDRKVQQLINGIQDGTDRATGKFYTVLDEKKWNDEVGVNSHSAKLTTAMHNTSTSQGAMSRRASTAFKNFVSNEIVGILQSITHAIIPETEVDIASKMTKFVEDSTNVRPHYETVYDYIMGGSSSIDEVDELIKVATGICKENADINVNKIFSQLSSLHFGVRGTARPKGFGMSSNKEVVGGELLADFTEDIVGIGASLAPMSKILEEYISELAGEQAVGELSDYKKKFRDTIIDYFQGGFDTNTDISRSSRGGRGNPYTATPIERYDDEIDDPGLIGAIKRKTGLGGTTTQSGYRQIDGSRNINIGLFQSARFKVLTGQIKVDPETNKPISLRNPSETTDDPDDFIYQNVSGADQQKFEENMYGSLTEVMHFLSMFSFMSFFCDYLREIETEVTVQKRDAVSFPNYILVTRLEYITRIFWALASTNFNNEMTKEREDQEIEDFKSERDMDFMRNIGKILNTKMPFQKKYELLKTEKEELETQFRNETDNYKRSMLQKDIEALDRQMNKRTDPKGIDVDQFRISSMNDVTKQINLIKERLKIPNIIVIDEKNKKAYYRLMFMPRILNLDIGTMNSYVSQQKDVLNGF